MFFDPEDRSFMKNHPLWTWRSASILVIDDINPGTPINDLVTPEKFLDMLKASPEESEGNIQAIRDKTIIWVLGKEDPRDPYVKGWQEMLVKIGVNSESISLVNLQT
jgi:hypothetical protein